MPRTSALRLGLDLEISREQLIFADTQEADTTLIFYYPVSRTEKKYILISIEMRDVKDWLYEML